MLVMKKANGKKSSSFFVVAALISLCASLVSCAKPGDSTVHDAMAAARQKNYDGAVSLFKRALDEESNYSRETILNFIANICMTEGDFESAIPYMEESLALKPDYRMLVQLGRTYREIGDDASAERSYARAVELNPEKGEAYASLGALKIASGKYSEAVADLTKAARAEPKIAVIRANLAVALALSGDTDSAEAEFAEAARLKCENLDDFRARAGM